LALAFGHSYRAFGGFSNTFFGYIVSGGKAPAAVGNYTYTYTVRFGIGHVLHAVFAGYNKLVKVAAYAHIGIAGTGRFCGVKSCICQFFFNAHINAVKRLLRINIFTKPGNDGSIIAPRPYPVK
jgi:hypothetical protein